MRVSKKKILDNKISLEHKGKLGFIDYEKARDQILTDLALSREFKNKVRYIIVTRQYESLKLNYDDIIQEIFIELYKKEPQYIFDQYKKRPGNIMALALTIAKSFFKINPEYPDYPNKSIVHRLNYHSTALGRADWVSPVDIDFYEEGVDRSEIGTVIGDYDSCNEIEEVLSVKDRSIEIVEFIRTKLVKKDNSKLNAIIRYFNGVKTVDENSVGYKKMYKEYKNFLLDLRKMLEEEGFSNLSDVFK